MSKHEIVWSYGVTTVPSRRTELLPRTLKSLAVAGFGSPRLFIDGPTNSFEETAYLVFGLELTVRCPAVRTAGNWILAIWELYIREPRADRYAIFQDDIVTCKNLRQYLESQRYPEKGYWNLCTYPQNLALAADRVGWYLSDQKGKGAQALVFDSNAVQALLGRPQLIDRMQDARRAHRSIDGSVIRSLKSAGWSEYVHNPSLVDHTGMKRSSMESKPQPSIESFRGENFDAMSLFPNVSPGSRGA